MRWVVNRQRLTAAIFGFGVITSGCAPEPMLTFTTDVPPLVLSTIDRAGIRDGRGRFREIFCAVYQRRSVHDPSSRTCQEMLHRLSNEPEATGAPIDLGRARTDARILLVPGLASDCLRWAGRTFEFAVEHMRQLGYDARLLDVGGLSSSIANSKRIRNAILAIEDDRARPLLLLTYSKGTVDTLEALVSFPELAARVTSVVSIAGAVNGSPLADAARAEILDVWPLLPGAECEVDDRGAIQSLRPQIRLGWIASHPLPPEIRYYSLGAFASRERTSIVLKPFHDKLALIDPRNDGQLLFQDQIIPNSTLLGYANADHLAIAVPILRKQPILGTALTKFNEYPREFLIEAIVRQVEEDLLTKK